MAATEHGRGCFRKIALRQDASADGIADVMVNVGDGIGELYGLTLERGWHAPGFRFDVPWDLRRFDDPITHLPGEIETAATFLQHLDHPQALIVVAEALLAEQFGEDLFACVPERRMAEIVAE